MAWRLVMLMSRAEVWITLIPGVDRRRSPKFWEGELAIDSEVTTLRVAGALMRVDSTLEAETTTTSSRFTTSSPSFFSAAFVICVSWARAAFATSTPVPARARRNRFIASSILTRCSDFAGAPRRAGRPRGSLGHS